MQLDFCTCLTFGPFLANLDPLFAQVKVKLIKLIAVFHVYVIKQQFDQLNDSISKLCKYQQIAFGPKLSNCFDKWQGRVSGSGLYFHSEISKVYSSGENLVLKLKFYGASI